MARSLPALGGLLRSLAIYYGVPLLRGGRMRRLYAEFIQPGDLCFDIGAHVGNRLRTFLLLGAHVVAIEPHPRLMRLLRRWYGSHPNVTLLESALSDQPGTADLHISHAHPTVTTLSTDWINSVQHSEGFARVRWDETVSVPVTTLDALIAEYGLPAFCKIDVEGGEADVLRGLSQPIPALSFEYVPATIDHGAASASISWRRAENITTTGLSVRGCASPLIPGLMQNRCTDQLAVAHPSTDRSGDVYARLTFVDARLQPHRADNCTFDYRLRVPPSCK